MWQILKFIPKNHLSYIVGKLVAMRLPGPFSLISVKVFRWLFDIDSNAAAQPLESYKSIADFFVRDLKPGLRPIAEGLVSPVDGKLRSAGKVIDGKLPQVKGKDYTLESFLGDPDMAKKFQGADFFNLYLSPQDYHQVHYPVEGRIVSSVYIPGKLWPVNDWSMSAIDNLFSVNERLVTYIESDFGLVAVVMVGATNVGKMTVSYDDWVTNTLSGKVFEVRNYEKPIACSKGAKLGIFHMGSSVVILVAPSESHSIIVSSQQVALKVELGTQLMKKAY